MKIRQFRYGADNLGYVIHGPRSALAVDGGAVNDIHAYLDKHELELVYVINTHRHSDHLSGSQELSDLTDAPLLTRESLLHSGTLPVGDIRVDVLETPGHTEDSLTFHAGDALITGDTLFNGTVGNCFSGDLAAFFNSIKQLMAFPPHTRIYAGHDYVRESMAFARRLEPGNRAIDGYLDRYDPYHVVSTLADELAVNPYLRFNTPELIAVLKQRQLPVDTEYRRWHSIMLVE